MSPGVSIAAHTKISPDSIPQSCVWVPHRRRWPCHRAAPPANRMAYRKAHGPSGPRFRNRIVAPDRPWSAARSKRKRRRRPLPFPDRNPGRIGCDNIDPQAGDIEIVHGSFPSKWSAPITRTTFHVSVKASVLIKKVSIILINWPLCFTFCPHPKVSIPLECYFHLLNNILYILEISGRYSLSPWSCMVERTSSKPLTSIV